MPPVFSTRDAVPLDGLLGQIANPDVQKMLEGLWPKDEKTDAATTELLEEQRRVSAAYARFFMTEDGRTILENLCDVTVRRPTFVSILGVDPLQAYAHGVQREGANALLWFILTHIAAGRSQQMPDREGSKP